MRGAGRRIAALMAARGLSKRDLQRLLEVSRGTVWNWLNDERFPARRLQPKLAEVLGTTVGGLHDGDPS